MSNWLNQTPEQITIPSGSATNAFTTASFTPQAVSKTPFISFQLTKLSPNNNLTRLFVETCNQDQPYALHGRWPSGSANDYLWCPESTFEQATSGTLTAQPFLTGSSTGSMMFHIGNLNARWIRVRLVGSGGQWSISGHGKGGE